MLSRYIEEYVKCHACKSVDTFLKTEQRLHFVQCETCFTKRKAEKFISGANVIKLFASIIYVLIFVGKA